MVSITNAYPAISGGTYANISKAKQYSVHVSSVVGVNSNIERDLLLAETLSWPSMATPVNPDGKLSLKAPTTYPPWHNNSRPSPSYSPPSHPLYSHRPPSPQCNHSTPPPPQIHHLNGPSTPTSPSQPQLPKQGLRHLSKRELRARRGFDKSRQRQISSGQASRERALKRRQRHRLLSLANKSPTSLHSLSLSPPPPTSTNIRIGHSNIGGIKLHEGYVVQHLFPHLDVCVLTETKTSDLAYFKYLRNTYKWRVLHVARPRTMDSSGNLSDAQGGVAVIIFTPALAKMQL
jgi:hypothetical protein